MTAPFFIQIYFNSKKALRYLLFSCHRLGIFEPIYFADYFTWTSITRHRWSENMMLEPLIISARTFLVITPSCPALITNNATQRRRNILIPSITKSGSLNFSLTQTAGWQKRASRVRARIWHPDKCGAVLIDGCFITKFEPISYFCLLSSIVWGHDWSPLVTVSVVSRPVLCNMIAMWELLLSGPGYENCHAVFMTSWQASAVSRHNCVMWARVKTDTRTWPSLIITTRGSRLCSHESPPSFPPPSHLSRWVRIYSQHAITILWKDYKICRSIWFL